ncbi:unnamed protein product [Spirodela intermedia]|uniref:Uncharacterized protein n=1 Tax=Spirodela intermedia TaxID=51605 RepID=A0A7I8KWP0_SPIIN|nr:unnamed protein product [Spirodela intermedia]
MINCAHITSCNFDDIISNSTIFSC